MRVTDNFVFFFSYRDVFSNHYRHKNPIQSGEKDFYTVEHYMMYQKAILFGDLSIAEQIAKVHNPNEAKALGRKVKNFNNKTWEKSRMNIVTQGLTMKMLANKDIMLNALTHRGKGRKFVEASPYDAIWGVKMDERDPLIEDPVNWRGLNLLGECWECALDMMTCNRDGA